MTRIVPHLLAPTLCLGLLAGAARADEAVIRKTLSERYPQQLKIDEVRKTPVNGLWEVRMGTDIVYTDATGDHILQGSLIDTKNKVSLTEERINKLTAVDFASLPWKDSFVIKQGNGSRKLAIFEDPNCGYCRKFERDLMALKDVSIHIFLYPILGPDSTAKSRDIWCSKDPAKAWRGWMLEEAVPVRNMGKCDEAALERNVAFGKKHRIQGTPAVFFSDGTRVPGAMPTEKVEQLLQAAARKS